MCLLATRFWHPRGHFLDKQTGRPVLVFSYRRCTRSRCCRAFIFKRLKGSKDKQGEKTVTETHTNT